MDTRLENRFTRKHDTIALGLCRLLDTGGLKVSDSALALQKKVGRKR